MNKFYRGLCVVLTAVLSLQSVSCGTLLYPERRGQTAGRLDVGVVLLDAVGLLCFLIPGVIAFAVDFSSGAIYLPAGKSAKSSDLENGMRVVRFDPKNYTPKTLEELISREAGREFHFSDERIKVTELKDRKQIPVYFAQFKDESFNNLAMLKQ